MNLEDGQIISFIIKILLTDPFNRKGDCSLRTVAFSKMDRSVMILDIDVDFVFFYQGQGL